MLRFPTLVLAVFATTFFIACESEKAPVSVHADELVSDLQFLSSDELKGRFPVTEESRIAQDFIIERFENLGVKSFDDDFRQVFRHVNPRNQVVFENAVNIVGFIEGSKNPDQFIAVTAHYDHLGERDGEIFNGADDNASGVGGLLAVARHFTEFQPENSLILLALDVEEQGLGGARYFVQNPSVPLDQIVMNLNMDMISNNFENEIYAVGTYHYPFLKSFVEESSENAPVNVLFGYDSDEWDQDWTFSSDHGPFHEMGIPFIYFGVEDHPYYHTPSDTFENTNPEFYVDAVYTILNVLRHFDRNLDNIRELSGR